jgi:hypothetical protein
MRKEKKQPVALVERRLSSGARGMGKPLDREDRVSKLEATISDIEVHVLSLQRALMPGGQSGEDQKVQSQMRDDVWCCEACGARLGIYNKQKDELRVRYKDFCVYIMPGVGGRTMVPCRRCGEQNVLQDTR